MELPAPRPAPDRTETRWTVGIFVAALLFGLWGFTVGWQSRNLPGIEFRQAQTALSIHYIQEERNFSIDYPTPVLGKPWSIPMEFPLYQWTAALVGDVTGYSPTKAGRLVTIACFYLMLPAVWILLGRWNVAPGRRWVTLAVIVSSPFYIFYGRGVFIETMALMFSLWFWVGFELAVERRHGGWLALTILVGTGAGLVKVTSFLLYLIPPACWAVRRLWRMRRGGGWGRELGWMAAAVAVPCVTTLWWLRHADAVKAANPLAHFLTSSSLQEFNLGNWQMRLSPELWAMKWRIIQDELTWFPLVASGLLFALFVARHRLAGMALCVGCFIAALVIFPMLYAIHDYYFMASALFLLLFLGLMLTGFAESRAPRWLSMAVLVTVVGCQAAQYLRHYYPTQSGISSGGDGLTLALKAMTWPGEVVVVFGRDWNSMIPFYAERRAIMVREAERESPAQLWRSLELLGNVRIGAVVLDDRPDQGAELMARFAEYGIDPRPMCRWRNLTVYLPKSRWKGAIYQMKEGGFDEVTWASSSVPDNGEPEQKYAGRWFDTAEMNRNQRAVFQLMQTQPTRFYSSFGPMIDRANGLVEYNAHPDTRLVFALPAGNHRLRCSVLLAPAAYDAALTDNRATDGVEVTLARLQPGGSREVLFSRLIDPRKDALDRGVLPLRVDFSMDQAGEVELFFGSGPAGNNTCDWIKLTRLVIDEGI
jgi:hypothetical protein